MISGLVYIEIFTLSDFREHASNRFAFEEYDDAYKYIDTHRETSMKVIIDLEQKPKANKELSHASGNKIEYIIANRSKRR